MLKQQAKAKYRINPNHFALALGQGVAEKQA